MFSFIWRRARERAARKAETLAAVSAALHAKLTAELAEGLEQALSEPGITPVQAEFYRRNAAALRRGIDAVLVPGANVGQLDIDDWPTRCGAVLAHAARNRAIKNLDNPHTRDDITYGITGAHSRRLF